MTSKSASEYQKKNDAAYAAANFVLFDERKTVASGSGRAAEYLEQSGKKGDSCNEKLPGKSDDVKVEIAALELLMGQEEAQICLVYISDACRKEREQDFRVLHSTQEETDHLVASRKR